MHTCSYYCDRPECIRAQRDELRQKLEQAEQIVPSDYSNSHQREWVGLTHDEVNSWELPDCPTVFEFAQFVEAKLKEKNCPSAD